MKPLHVTGRNVVAWGTVMPTLGSATVKPLADGVLPLDIVGLAESHCTTRYTLLKSARAI